MQIRLLQYQELELCAELVKKFFNGKYPIGSFKDDVFIHTWTSLITTSNGAIIGTFRNNKLTGVLGFVINLDPNDGELTAKELLWFTDPDSKQGDGLRLIRKYEEISKQLGVKRIGMAHLQSGNNVRIKSIFQKLGYQSLETFYMKEIS